MLRGARGVGPDHRDRRRRRRSGSDAVVAQQHEAVAGDPAGELDLRSGAGVHADAIDVDERAARTGRAGTCRRSTRRTASSTISPIDAAPRAERGAELVAVAVGAGQLDVEAGAQRGAGGRRTGTRRRGGTRLELAHREVVGDDRAVEAPLVAEQVGEQPAVGAARHAVELVVAVHHRGDGRRRARRPRTDGGRRRAAHARGGAPAPSSARPPTRRSRRSAWRWPPRRRPARRPAGHATNARPICVTRYGSSPKVSSSRPHRGSRQTSSTGDRPWWAPIARIWTADRVGRSPRLCSGRNVAATPIACGNTVASRAISPAQISSWTIAGIPRRVCSSEVTLDVVGERGRVGGAEVARAADAGDVPDAVGEHRCRARRRRTRR